MERSIGILAQLAQADTAPLAETLLALESLRTTLRGSPQPQWLTQLAAAIPSRVSHLRPETSLALQRIVLELARHRPRIPQDLDRLEAQLRIPWLRAWITTDASVALDGVTAQTLLAVVHGWTFERVLDPGPLLEAMVVAPDPRLRILAIARTKAVVSGLGTSPRRAYRLLAPLLEDPDPRVRADALAVLSQGWVVDLPPADARHRIECVRRALRHDAAFVSRAAIDAAARLGDREGLRAALKDGHAPVATRAAALAALGGLADDDDLDLALELMGVGFGAGVRALLLQAHRHGVFVRQRHIEAVLARFDAHTDWTADELVRVTHLVRAELTEHLARLHADDPRWIRRAALLAASIDPAATELLTTLLERVRAPKVARAVVAAVGTTLARSDRLEVALLSWLDHLPEDILPVLRAKGGDATVLRLRAWVTDPARVVGHRTAGIGVLWSLCPDRAAEADRLVRQLGPHESGLLAGAFRQAEDPLAARLLAEVTDPAVDPRPVDGRDRLAVSCRSKDVARMGEVEALFRSEVTQCVRRALAGDFVAKRVELPELEQTIYRYGRALVDDRRPVRLALSDAPETGRDLVLRFIIDWLREDPEPPVTVALLEMLARHAPRGPTLRAIEPYWRHGHREVRRAAVETLVAAKDASQGLELSLCLLVEDRDWRMQERALAAVASWGATWAEPLVLGALESREMAVKKAAAEALARIATSRSIPALLRWLAVHDNASFRESLRRALERAAGPLKVAVIVEALEGQSERRSIELLWSALAGWISVATALRLAGGEAPAHAELLQACLDGRVALTDGSADDLAQALHRARLTAPRPAELSAVDRLRTEGFSAERALAVLALDDPSADPAVRSAVRRCLPEWLAWVRGAPQPSPSAVSLLLDACRPEDRELFDAIFEVVQTSGPCGAVGQWVERCIAPRSDVTRWRGRAIETLRRLGPDPDWGGLHRYRVLLRLGTVVTLDDLLHLLDVSRGCADYPEQSATLLREAFRVPGWTEREPEALTELREETSRWHTMDSEAREGWVRRVAQQRPLGLPVPAEHAEPPKPRFVPCSADHLDALVSRLDADEPELRTRAAHALLDWSDVPDAAQRVLHSFLARPFPMKPEGLARIAAALDSWPSEGEQREHAEHLIEHLDARQRRAFMRQWIQAWEAGAAWAEPLIRRCPEALLPLAWSRALEGDVRLARFVQRDGSLSVEAYRRQVETLAPEEVAHLRDEPTASSADTGASLDPIVDATADELVKLLEDEGLASGLAVRAIHALSLFEEVAIEPLDLRVTDPRPAVRSAALRALRRVAPGQRYLEAAYRVLLEEDRRDVVLSLLRTLAHGRYHPALQKITERLWHRDPHMRRAAHEALLAWGHDVLPDLRRLASRARPDRRRAIVDVLEAIEGAE